MTEIAVTSQSYLPADRPWLQFEATGTTGPVPTWHGQINLSLFTKNTHYPNGFIPSGVAVGKVTSSGRLGPYDNTATDGRQTCVGHLYNAVSTDGDLTRKVQVAIVDCFAVILKPRLPSGHGLDTAGEADLPRLHYRA